MNTEDIINELKIKFSSKSKEELVDIILNMQSNDDEKLTLIKGIGAYGALKLFNVEKLMDKNKFDEKLDLLASELNMDNFKEIYYRANNEMKNIKTKEQINSSDEIKEGQHIMKGDYIYKVIEIDNTYAQSDFILKNIVTHEKESFSFIDLIGAYKIKFENL